MSNEFNTQLTSALNNCYKICLSFEIYALLTSLASNKFLNPKQIQKI